MYLLVWLHCPYFPANIADFILPDWLAPFRTRIENPQLAQKGELHGYLDDYRLEALWSRPRKSLEAVGHFGTLITPDFSLYREWPVAIQIYNTYCSRWLGAFWQANGLYVGRRCPGLIVPAASFVFWVFRLPQ